MRRRLTPFLAGAAAFLILSPAHPQQAAPEPARRDAFEARLSGITLPGMQLMTFLDQAKRAFFPVADADLDGKLSASDLELERAQNANGNRVGFFAQLLRHDTNYDGIVTRDEVVRFETLYIRRHALGDRAAMAEETIRQRIDEAVTRHMRADLNGDGRIEWKEMLESGRPQTTRANGPMEELYRIMFTLDENADGATDSAEFGRAIRRVFRSVDTDRNGTLSQEEVDAFYVRLGGGPPRALR